MSGSALEVLLNACSNNVGTECEVTVPGYCLNDIPIQQEIPVCVVDDKVEFESVGIKVVTFRGFQEEVDEHIRFLKSVTVDGSLDNVKGVYFYQGNVCGEKSRGRTDYNNVFINVDAAGNKTDDRLMKDFPWAIRPGLKLPYGGIHPTVVTPAFAPMRHVLGHEFGHHVYSYHVCRGNPEQAWADMCLLPNDIEDPMEFSFSEHFPNVYEELTTYLLIIRSPRELHPVVERFIFPAFMQGYVTKDEVRKQLERPSYTISTGGHDPMENPDVNDKLVDYFVDTGVLPKDSREQLYFENRNRSLNVKKEAWRKNALNILDRL